MILISLKGTEAREAIPLTLVPTSAAAHPALDPI